MLNNVNNGKDYGYFRARNSSSYYTYNLFCESTITGAMAVDTLRAIPFVSTPSGTIGRFGFEVTTAAASSVGRCGIYTVVNSGALYPNALVVETGELSCATTGEKAVTTTTVLEPNTVYFAAFLFGTATPTVRIHSSTHCPQLFGVPSTFGSSVRASFSIAQAYGAIPLTFPSGASFATGGSPEFYHYFSS
jgi:hypothetical protein